MARALRYDIKRLRDTYHDPDEFDKHLALCEQHEVKLKGIYDDYLKNMVILHAHQSEILKKLEPVASAAHSIRTRIKDPDHLIIKIIRKVSEESDNRAKYYGLNPDNYYKVIMDLIGVRILVLHKKNWKDVHDAINKAFPTKKTAHIKKGDDPIEYYDKEKNTDHPIAFIAEPPIAYYTDKDDKPLYLEKNVKAEESQKGYNTVHYIVRFKEYYFELQVRTLFEEGYLEFDHEIKYPADNKNQIKEDYIKSLKAVALSADRLIAFYDKNESLFMQPKEETP